MKRKPDEHALHGIPECNACGICCTTDIEFGRGGYVRLRSEDIDRLPEKYRLKVVMDSDPGVHRLGTKGTPVTGYRCTALRGEPNRSTRCDIYDQRPKMCRAYERGSVDCRRERAQWLFVNRKLGAGAGV